MAIQDETNVRDRFNFLTIEEIFHEFTIRKTGQKQRIWKARCKCDCGKEKTIKLQSVVKGKTKSCGCYNRIAASQRFTKFNTDKNKYGIDHPLYQSWKAMKNKCNNPNTADYLKGISYCKEWEGFEPFYEWGIKSWKDKLCLYRIDRLKDYSPDNCCFKSKTWIAQHTDCNSEKAKNTCLERYGVEHYNKTPGYLVQLKKTSLEKYGCEHFSQNEEVKAKLRKTCLEKFGSENPLSNKEIRDKTEQTNLQRYGFRHPSQVPEIRQKQKDTLMAKYGTLVVNSNYGKAENTVREWLEKESGKEFKSDWKILGGKQIDMYNPELKLGVEYCGLYWHSEYNGRDKNYHYSKYLQCLNQDIRLITIFSDEWTDREKQVKNFLKSVIGSYDKKIFARKCQIAEIDNISGQKFMQQYHIQGQKTKSRIYFSLLFEDEIVGCASMRMHHRNSTDLVLDRLCFKDGVQIPGGASRLIKRCMVWAKESGYDKITSWSDNRWSQGGVYLATGFSMDKELKSDYSYIKLTNPCDRKSKQSMQKKKIGCPDGYTENEWTKELGFSRIWDCGKTRWVKQL